MASQANKPQPDWQVEEHMSPHILDQYVNDAVHGENGDLPALRQRLDDRVSMSVENIRLPRSGVELSIHQPTKEERDRIFADARDDPDRTSPFWMLIWASGLALADEVFERADEFSGTPVLELGSGLGTTASVALSCGANLIAVDYSDLALDFCRLNAVTNSGRAPRTARMNWRKSVRQDELDRAVPGGFPIILAADVLYESRDIEPLIALISRLLAPDGCLWLAEPNRQVAERFLHALALQGWEGSHRREYGPWHDGATDPVNIHFLRRPSSIDPLRTTLGGWRT